MEIHKPKPVRSWRELLTEVGVIVLSVCIALAAEQAVEWAHWRGQVQEAKGIIANEMAENLRSSITRLRVQDCVERRLDELGKILDEASRTGSLPPVGNIGIPPRRGWRTGAWDSVVASQTATHFPRQQLAGLASAYLFVHKADDLGPQEVRNWSELGAIIGPGRRLDPASEAELRKAISIARGDSRIMAGLSLNLIRAVNQLKLPFSQDDLAEIATARNEVVEFGNTPSSFRICSTTGAIPANYGENGYPQQSGQRDEALKLLPSGK